MTYGSGGTLRITGELAFLDFQKQLQISSINRTNLHNLIYHIYTHNNSDLDRAYATQGTFRFIGKIFTITNRFKLKIALIFKLGTTDMVEQSKTHPFNLS